MSQRKQVKIADLTPTTKGDLSLTFEVAQILEKSQGGDQVTCKIVDETGVINAFFDQFAKYVVVGSVYEIINFRCKVVNHYLRLQMIKATQLAKKPLKVGFKDFENDLSKKFYVEANKEKKNDNKEQNQPKPAKQETIKPAKIEQKKQETQKIPQNKQKKHQKKNERNYENDDRQQRRNTKYTQKKKEKVEQTQEQHEEQKSTKKKYVPKNSENKEESKFKQDRNNHKQFQGEKKENKSRKDYPKEGEEIKLEKMKLHQRKKMTFVVKVIKDTEILKEKYFMCKVADSSGATYFEFEIKFHKHIQDGWYRLSKFTVYPDKVYGFIASQQQSGQFERLDEQGQASEKLLFK